jgi:hypothetical protein
MLEAAPHSSEEQHGLLQAALKSAEIEKPVATCASHEPLMQDAPLGSDEQTP